MYTHYTTDEMKTKLDDREVLLWRNMHLLICEDSVLSSHFLIHLLSFLRVLWIRSTRDVIICLLSREI